MFTVNKYDKKPKNLGTIECAVSEFFNYTYLPVKLTGSFDLNYENRLGVFDVLIGRACCDFIGDFGIDEYVAHNIYITAKNQYQRNGCGFNRPGWHSDGFGTPDISYIWSNKQPTIFNKGPFFLTEHDKVSMRQMEAQAHRKNNYKFENNTLLRMDQYSIHKVGKYEEGPRAFVKICFSKDIYALAGNSVNYELDYNLEYKERQKERNIPQS